MGPIWHATISGLGQVQSSTTDSIWEAKVRWDSKVVVMKIYAFAEAEI